MSWNLVTSLLYVGLPDLPYFTDLSRISAYHFTVCPMPLCMKITIFF